MKLSNNLSLSEVLVSQTAKRLGLSNEPTKEHLENLGVTASKIFQPIRDYFKVPIYVSSGYRSKELNKAIGGAKTSQHMKGEALDLDADVYGVITNSDIFNYIKDNLEFDQLIWEFGDDNNPNWVHVSFSEGKNRMKVMNAYKKDGRTYYDLF
tara:strand:- start:1451 stop:1909 length:459 start_codon:yes stop_codon:yes gene_type:complete